MWLRGLWSHAGNIPSIFGESPRVWALPFFILDRSAIAIFQQEGEMPGLGVSHASAPNCPKGRRVGNCPNANPRQTDCYLGEFRTWQHDKHCPRSSSNTLPLTSRIPRVIGTTSKSCGGLWYGPVHMIRSRMEPLKPKHRDQRQRSNSHRESRTNALRSCSATTWKP